ncbi:formylglycine-generating enzyme family protein [Aquisphaera insulae]|uniref:formylglycine-generating enzyme family protein n=1 Tax=Aquisphaera insulae TaxID=2712864 RepID=UPI003F7285A5
MIPSSRRIGLVALWALVAGMSMSQAARSAPPGQHQDPAGSMKPYIETLPGTAVAFEMLPIPGGTFLMGSAMTEVGRREDEGPRHAVRIAPFWMGRCEVTWEEYDQFARKLDLKRKAREKVDLAAQPEAEKQADAVTRPTGPYLDETFGFGHDGQPAIGITHHAAMEYCRWLSARTGKVYRLPTEAEWEYACRAGTTTAYSWGDDPARIGEFAWDVKNAEKPQKVGMKKPNPWGLHDMHGNVAEWCLDHYRADAYRRIAIDANRRLPGGKAPASGPVIMPDAEEYPYVVRGGSWDDDADRLRSGSRRGSNPDWCIQDPDRPQSIWWHTDATFVGFRIVRPVVEQEDLKGLKSPVVKGKRSHSEEQRR